MYYFLNSGKTLSTYIILSIVERPSQDVLLFEQWKDPLKTYYSLEVERPSADVLLSQFWKDPVKMCYFLNSGETFSRYITLWIVEKLFEDVFLWK